VIEIQDLYKFYGDRRAIGPVSATIGEGEVVGMLGLNGTGKTTTLRILACDLLPTMGTVKVAGYDVVESPDAVKAMVGYLPDTPPLYGDMTVTEYLTFAAEMRRVPGRDRPARVARAIEQIELGEVRRQFVGTLSHGFKQRVGIAQAIVHQPRLVVLDEPISGLDPVQIVEMRRVVRELGKEHTVVVSSHILTEISRTCDRILVLDQGRFVWSGGEDALSSFIAEGLRLDVTLRRGGQAAPETAKSALGEVQKLAGIVEARILDTELPEGQARLRIKSGKDMRGEIARLLTADFELLEMTTPRELENMFLELLGGGASRGRSKSEARSNEGSEPRSSGSETGSAP
jgi:ABC-2 type transport system ATP-binding protein